jgi:hypothetical protein
MKPMKRLTESEIALYTVLEEGDPLFDMKAVAFSLVPDPDDPKFSIVKYYQENPFTPDGTLKPIEYVYVLVNESIHGMVKIGMTTRGVDQRAKEISGATGVPTPWEVVFSFKCYKSYELEQEIHEYLNAVRVSENREMFRLTPNQAMEVVKKLGEKYTNPAILLG